jgi:hypothetical protein
MPLTRSIGWTGSSELAEQARQELSLRIKDHGERLFNRWNAICLHAQRGMQEAPRVAGDQESIAEAIARNERERAARHTEAVLDLARRCRGRS